MNVPSRGRPRRLLFVAVAAAALVAPASAFAHARLSPPIVVAKQSQWFVLAVPTEKEGARTTKVVLTVPAGFSIDSFAPVPGWKRQTQQSGSGDSAVVQSVTWTGGSVPTEEDAVFGFLGEPQSSKTYTFGVEQSYSDGSIVNWNGSESSDTPSPTISAKSSFGGGGSSTLAIVALVVGAVGVLLAVLALVARGGSGGGGRQLA
jgi:uncharacterized protein YcnI